jgi:hypothetical protein
MIWGFYIIVALVAVGRALVLRLATRAISFFQSPQPKACPRPTFMP